MKISKLTRTASVIALAALAAGACDDGLTDLNENPNSPANVAAPLLFSAGTKGVVDRAFGSTFFWDYSNAWVQHWAKIQYTTEDRYGLRPAANDAHWTGFYSGSTLGDGGLIDLHRVVLKADSLNQPGWKAQGLTMRTFTIGIVTDTWGDVPYSAALQGIEALSSKPEAVQPTYDTQESIYRQMLADLRTANQLLVPGPAVIGSEDLIYNGNAPGGAGSPTRCACATQCVCRTWTPSPASTRRRSSATGSRRVCSPRTRTTRCSATPRWSRATTR